MWSYRNPVDIRFGTGAFGELGRLIGARRYALVTYSDAYFQELAAKLAALAGAPLLTLDDIAPNPDIADLRRQVARFAALPEQPEMIVALGGGSVIDSAKVFAAGPDFARTEAYLRKQLTADALTPLPLIAVPTTSGTGSEVTSWGTVWDGDGGEKHSLAHPGLYPQYAVVDPALTLGKPRELTIQTGLDALSHALESLWNRNANPISATHAVAAAREVLATLPALADDLGNIALRERMSRAALHAGLAFSNTRTAIAHSLSYPITLKHGVPHGIACSFTLPLISRSVANVDGLCAEGLRAIFGTDAHAAAAQLEATLTSLGVALDYRAYGIAPAEWNTLITHALTGERGQNFVGSEQDLLRYA